MNKLFIMMCLLFIFIVPQAWGSMTQYPNPYRQTIWNNITDDVHTFGQTRPQANRTLRKLHQARTRTRLHSISLAWQKALLSN